MQGLILRGFGLGLADDSRMTTDHFFCCDSSSSVPHRHMEPCHALRMWMDSRSGQDEWDRAEQARHRRPPRRAYAQRYTNALDREPGPRRPRLQVQRSKKPKKNQPQAARGVIVASRSAVMRAIVDRPGQLDSRTPEHFGEYKAKRGAKIDELWFDRV